MKAYKPRPNTDYNARTRDDRLSAINKNAALQAAMRAEREQGDAKMKEMYEKYHPRVVAALTDHKWDELIREGSAECGFCSCCSFCP